MIGQIVPFPASGGGPVGDVSIGVQSIQSGTTNTTVSGTSTNLTGITPVAALVVHSRHAIANDPGESAHADFSIGFLEATNHLMMSARMEDAAASTDTGRIASDAMIARSSLTTSETLGRSATGALASGGVDFTFSGTDLVNRRLTYMAFGGADADADSHYFQYAAIARTATTTFEPDIVFTTSAGWTADAVSGPVAVYSFGIALKDGTQMCVLGAEPDAAAAGAPVQAILTNRAGGQIGATTGTLLYDLTASGFGATGYTLTPSVDAGNRYTAQLAIGLGGRRSKLLAFTTPTSTGNHAITGVGFTPQAALIVLTNLEATDPTFPVSTDDPMSGLSISLIAENAASHSVRSDSGADPTDTASQSREIALIGPSATDCDAITATLVSFDSDGMTLNYSAVQGTGKKGFILFIE